MVLDRSRLQFFSLLLAMSFAAASWTSVQSQATDSQAGVSQPTPSQTQTAPAGQVAAGQSSASAGAPSISAPRQGRSASSSPVPGGVSNALVPVGAALPASYQFERVLPTEPAKAAATFRCLHGFRMELLAAEPLVEDPVALEYDEWGRAWVVEMRDYPFTDKTNDRPFVEKSTDAPLGRIRILEDSDGDGRFERSDIFADNLSWPTGIALWEGGCYVTATPDVWYLKDTDGDRRADVRRQVFTGFRKLNVQAVINNLRWGLDHRLYAAGGSNGGLIRQLADPAHPPISFSRADFAFEPRRTDKAIDDKAIGDGTSERFELLSGGARFGQTFDDWGNRFLCNIRNPMQHVLFENRYLLRNPHLPVTQAVQDVAEAGDTLPVYRVSPPEPWRMARALRYRTEAGGMSLPRSELAGEGYFTSSSGITVYRGTAYPEAFRGHAFLGEVAGNLIHHQVPTPLGPTFRSRRGDEQAEFVASTDNWFRPVNLTNAPDGTLHICDMYRETIEHPWSIPDDMKAVLDLESGRDRGRLYRLAPPGFRYVPPQKWPGAMSSAELVELLSHPDAWWRETAHRLLFERQDRSTVPLLERVLRESSLPLARLHAFWSLQGLNSLTKESIRRALQDSAAGVRRQALIVADAELIQSAELLEAVLPTARDPETTVRFQAALTLGTSSDPRVAPALSELLRQDANDPWLVTAVLTACRGRADRVLSADHARDVRYRLAVQVGAEANEEAVPSLLQRALIDSQDTAVLAGLADGLRRSQKSLSQFATTLELKASLQNCFVDAAQQAVSNEQPLEARLAAVQLLAQGSFAEARAPLAPLLDPRQPAELQRETIRALVGFREQAVPELLLKNYRACSPAVRADIVDALASRAEWNEALLTAVEQHTVGVGDIPQARRTLLSRSKNPEVATRAEKLFAANQAARATVIAAYQPALQAIGDAEQGRIIFRRECQSCHQLRGEGHAVGPNLATILHRTPDELLTHILDPNREIAPNFLEYTIVLNQGRVLTGLIADETATTITLRRAENNQEVVLRQEIEEISSSGKSLMPEGLEQKISVMEMRDLLGYLLGNKRPAPAIAP